MQIPQNQKVARFVETTNLGETPLQTEKKENLDSQFCSQIGSGALAMYADHHACQQDLLYIAQCYT